MAPGHCVCEYSSRDKTADVIYFGVPSAKMVLLVKQTPQTAVDVWVAGASAYATGMNTTVSVRMLRPFSVPQEWQLVENGEIAVEVRGDRHLWMHLNAQELRKLDKPIQI